MNRSKIIRKMKKLFAPPKSVPEPINRSDRRARQAIARRANKRACI